MSKIQNYILLNAEKGKDLLEQQQNEVNHYSDMTPEQVQAELTNKSLSMRGQAVFTNQFIETPDYIQWLKEHSKSE